MFSSNKIPKHQSEYQIVELNRKITMLLREQMSDAFVSVDRDWTILSFNDKAEDILDCLAQKAIGSNLGKLVLTRNQGQYGTFILNSVDCYDPEHHNDELPVPGSLPWSKLTNRSLFSIGMTMADDRFRFTITLQPPPYNRFENQTEVKLMTAITNIKKLLRLIHNQTQYRIPIPTVIRDSKKGERTADTPLEGTDIDIQKQKSEDEKYLRIGKSALQMAHDVNNLLVPLMAIPELLMKDYPVGSKQEQYCKTLINTAQRLVQINSQVLNSTEGSVRQYETFELNRIVNEASNLASYYLGNRLKVDSCFINRSLPIFGQSEQLYQAILTLLLNTKNVVSRKKGIISVNTHYVQIKSNKSDYLESDESGRVPVPAGDYAKLVITDDRVGIAANDLDHIFDHYYSVEVCDGYSGSGLGLDTIKSAVHDHNGYLDVSTSSCSRITFSIYLPISSYFD